MNSAVVFILAVVSLVLGIIKYLSLAGAYVNDSWPIKFVELWNGFVSFFVAGLVGYYFVLVRIPSILNGTSLLISDLVLFIIFMLGTFGHLGVMSKNVTEGVAAILKRVLVGK